MGDDAKLKRLELRRSTDHNGCIETPHNIVVASVAFRRQAQATTRALYGEMYNAVRGDAAGRGSWLLIASAHRSPRCSKRHVNVAPNGWRFGGTCSAL